MNKLISISILLFQVNLVLAQSINSSYIDSLITSYADEYSIVGLSIGTVFQDSIETTSYGYTSHNSEFEISEQTQFNVASITKLFTATAINQLVEEGKLSLDDNIYELLPTFQMRDKRFKQITVRHLLTHSSGLMWDNKLKNSPNDASALPLYVDNLKNKKLAFEPGSQMSYETYSNVAFDLLGLIIEEVSNKPYDEFIRYNQLSKIGLVNSTYDYKTIDSSNLALPQIIAGKSKDIERLNLQGIDRTKNPILNGKPLALDVHHSIGEEYEHNPSGNLMSSTGELVLWINEILNIYHREKNVGTITHTSLLDMWQKNHLASGDNIFIGLGWWIKEDPKYGTSYFHVGTNPGYCSILMIYPESDFGIAILSNGWYGKEVIWNKLFNQIVELYLGE